MHTINTSQLLIFPEHTELINSRNRELLANRRLSDKLEQEIIFAMANMDVDALENITPENVQLSGNTDNDRADFFKMLRSKFKELRKSRMKKFEVSNSLCHNCYKNKKVTVFTETRKQKFGFALAFERKNNLISNINICDFYGIKKQDIEEESHSRFSYFSGH